ncbi:hypothetical protein [Nostoc sp. TCL240-02]|uniref:hypothetical protein n=1 Tax=Nostoc sp. TCL240-02 TaxID=2572090 RepID=UPI00157F9912|nr:hypothetical protein [Nostoc sp. TCL240-02]
MVKGDCVTNISFKPTTFLALKNMQKRIITELIDKHRFLSTGLTQLAQCDR